MNLRQNAIDSIRLGVEDYEAGVDERLISSVRNLHSGILLLFKEKLRRLSPEESNDVLIRQIIVPHLKPDGSLSFVGKGKTVGVPEIRLRFESLGIATQWDRFLRVSKLRNDIEHHFTSLNRNSIRGAISDTFLIVRNFLWSELDEDPMEALGSATWDALLKVSEVFEQERADCLSQVDAVQWGSPTLAEGVASLTCSQCGSPLLSPSVSTGPYQDIVLNCRSCGELETQEAFAERAVSSHLSEDNDLAYRDGVSGLYVTCPYCIKETYVVAEQQCVSCKQQCSHTCERCDSAIPSEELSDEPYCSWCQQMMSKD
jgi:hypothetical protein